MKCPLTIFGRVTQEEKVTVDAADCLKEECAWWDERLKKCAVLATNRVLLELFRHLSNIAKELTLRRK